MRKLLIPLIGIIILISLITGIANADTATTEYLYTTYYDTGALSIIDTGTNTQVTSAPISYKGRDIVASPNGEKLYIVTGIENQLIYLDPVTNIITKTISLPDPTGINVAKNNMKLYVSLFDNGKVAVIDTATGTIIKNISVGTNPTYIKINKNGDTAYVVNEGSYTISVIDLTTETVVATLSTVNKYPHKIELNNDNSLLYCISHNHSFSTNGTIYIFDTSTNTLKTSFTTDIYPYALDIDAYDNYYVGLVPDDTSYHRRYLKYNSSDGLVNRVTVPYDSGNNYDYPVDIIVGGNGLLYVAHGSTISVYNRLNNSLIANIYTAKGNAEKMTTIIPVVSTTTPYKITVATMLGIIKLEHVQVSVTYNDMFIEQQTTDSMGSVSFNLETGKTYTISAVNATQGIDKTITLTVNPSDSYYQINIPVTDVIGISSISDQFYQPPEATVTASETLNVGTNTGYYNIKYVDEGLNTTAVTLYLYKNSTNGANPVLVSSYRYNLANTGDLIINGDCENGKPTLDSLSSDINLVSAISSDTAHSGTHSLVLNTSAGGTNVRYYQMGEYDMNGLNADKTYTFDSWVHVPSGQGITLPLVFTQGLDDIAAYSSNNPTVNDQWQKLNVQFTCNPSAVWAVTRLYLYQDVTNKVIYFDDVSLTSDRINHTFAIAGAGGNNYYVKVDATRLDNSNATYYSAYTFPGAKVLGGLLPNAWYWWIAFLTTCIVFGTGTVSRKGLIGMIGVGLGFIFLAWGWWSLYVPDLIMGGVLLLALVFCIVVWIGEREKYG